MNRDIRKEDWFLDRQHPLDKGCVLAGLSRFPKSLWYPDSSLLKNHGTLSSNMDPATAWVWSTQLERFVLLFGGSTEEVNIVTSDTLNFGVDAFTISTYFKTSSSPEMAIVGKIKLATPYTGYSLKIIGGKCVFEVNDDTGYAYINTVESFNDNAYHHFVGVRVGALGNIFIDGVLVKSGSVRGGNCNWSGPTYIARNGDWTGYNFVGAISDVCLWNRALSINEIVRLADRSNVTYDGWIQSLRGWVPGIAVAGGGISQAIGQVSETDSQSALSKIKEKSVALQTETDSCLAATTAKSVAVGLQEETDSSSALTSAKAAAIAIQIETDEALPLGAAISLAIGQVSETDEAFSLSVSKAYTIGQASETDSLSAMAEKLKSKSIGLVASVELALPFATGLLSKGVEFRAPDTRLHFRAPDTRLHFLA